MSVCRTLTLSSMVFVAALLSSVSFASAGESQTNAPAAAVEAAPVQAPLPLAKPAAAGTNTLPSVFNTPAGGKIGVIDIMRISEESSLGKRLKGRFKEKSNKLQTQLNTKQKQLEKQKATLQAKLPNLIPDQRAAKIKEYEKKVEEFKKAVTNAEKELMPLQEELTRSITMETAAACEAYAKANGFAVVVLKKDLFYVAANYEQKDITAEVIKLMDEKSK